MSIFGNAINMSLKSLDYLWTQQEVIANNLANVDTPNYKAKYVTFENEYKSRLQEAVRQKSNDSVTGAIEDSKYQIYEKADESARLDGNNVNTDVEEVEMARTTLQYQYVLQSVSNDIARLKTAIAING